MKKFPVYPSISTFINIMISITTACPEDITPLLEMINKAYRGEDAKRGWTHEADILEGGIRVDDEQLEQIVDSENETLLLARNGGRIVGCVYLKHQDENLYLGMLSVHP